MCHFTLSVCSSEPSLRGCSPAGGQCATGGPGLGLWAVCHRWVGKLPTRSKFWAAARHPSWESPNLSGGTWPADWESRERNWQKVSLTLFEVNLSYSKKASNSSWTKKKILERERKTVYILFLLGLTRCPQTRISAITDQPPDK